MYVPGRVQGQACSKGRCPSSWQGWNEMSFQVPSTQTFLGFCDLVNTLGKHFSPLPSEGCLSWWWGGFSSLPGRKDRPHLSTEVAPMSCWVGGAASVSAGVESPSWMAEEQEQSISTPTGPGLDQQDAQECCCHSLGSHHGVGSAVPREWLEASLVPSEPGQS